MILDAFLAVAGILGIGLGVLVLCLVLVVILELVRDFLDFSDLSEKDHQRKIPYLLGLRQKH